MNDIDTWLVSGAGVREGLRLLNIYAPNRHIARLVEMKPKRYGYLLTRALSKFATGQTVRQKGSFRKEWPFLSEPDCPPELKILAADKITAWYDYVAGHEELFSCTDLESCYLTAKKVVEKFNLNRKIFSELDFYKRNSRVLGKHEIFASMKKMESIRKLGIVELLRKQKNITGNIWRIKNEIAKGDKPHLLSEREARLKEKTLELSEVNRLIEEYGKK